MNGLRLPAMFYSQRPMLGMSNSIHVIEKLKSLLDPPHNSPNNTTLSTVNPSRNGQFPIYIYIKSSRKHHWKAKLSVRRNTQV